MMASRMIGRAPCPECGFAAAHVKESDKCTYRYCPECGAQHHARTPRQKTDLLAKMRDAIAPPHTEPTPTATENPPPVEQPPTPSLPSPTPTPAAPPRRRGLFA